MTKFLTTFIIFNMLCMQLAVQVFAAEAVFAQTKIITPAPLEAVEVNNPQEGTVVDMEKVSDTPDAKPLKAKKSFKPFKKEDPAKVEEEKREAKTFAFIKRKEKPTQEVEQKSHVVDDEDKPKQSAFKWKSFNFKFENSSKEKQQKAAKSDRIKKKDGAKAEEQTVIKDEIQENKTAKAPEKKKKRTKKEDKFSEYTIPLDGYMPVGSGDDKSIKISGSVQKTLELNLADCLELALINNPKIKAAYANAEAIKYKKGQTLSNYSPVVNFQGGISRLKPDMSTFRSRGYVIDPFTKYTLGTIGISQLVYDFGLTQNQYTIDKLNWESSKSNIDSVVNEVVCQVKEGYYNLVYAIEAKRVAQETLEQFEQMYKQAQAFYEVGTKPKVDVTIAQVNMEDARAKLIAASNNVDVVISGLNNVMGLPFIPPYIVDTKAEFQDVDITMRKAVEIANEARPDLKVAKLSVEMAEQYVKLAKKTYLPKLEFSANFALGGVDSFTDTNWYDMGGFLTFPAVNPFLIRNQIKEAKAQYEKQKYDTKASINDIYYEIQSTYVKLVDAKQRVPVAKLAVTQAKENYDLSKGRYRVGVSDAIEYKEAQIQYYDARLSYLNTLYEYNSAKANLEKAIGQTLAPINAEEEGI